MPAYDLDLSKMILSEDDKPIIHTHNYIEESRTEATCLFAVNCNISLRRMR